MGHGGLRHEECPRDLAGGQASEQAERERDAGLLRQNGMTGREHEAQQVVAYVVLDRGVEVDHGLLALELAAHLFVLALGDRRVSEMIDRPALPDGHEPGARVVRDA